MITSKNHINKYKLEKPYLEKDLQGKIGRWLNDGNMFTHACEVKLVTGGTLAFSKFEDQQLPCLVDVAGKGKYYKLTDASIGKKPFDYFCMEGESAYVACQFWKNIQQEIAYYMDIDGVMMLKKTGAKSIKETDFMLLGTTINLAKYKKGIKRK